MRQKDLFKKELALLEKSLPYIEEGKEKELFKKELVLLKKSLKHIPDDEPQQSTSENLDLPNIPLFVNFVDNYSAQEIKTKADEIIEALRNDSDYQIKVIDNLDSQNSYVSNRKAVNEAMRMFQKSDVAFYQFFKTNYAFEITFQDYVFLETTNGTHIAVEESDQLKADFVEYCIKNNLHPAKVQLFLIETKESLASAKMTEVLDLRITQHPIKLTDRKVERNKVQKRIDDIFVFVFGKNYLKRNQLLTWDFSDAGEITTKPEPKKYDQLTSTQFDSIKKAVIKIEKEKLDPNNDDRDNDEFWTKKIIHHIVEVAKKRNLNLRFYTIEDITRGVKFELKGWKPENEPVAEPSEMDNTELKKIAKIVEQAIKNYFESLNVGDDFRWTHITRRYTGKVTRINYMKNANGRFYKSITSITAKSPSEHRPHNIKLKHCFFVPFSDEDVSRLESSIFSVKHNIKHTGENEWINEDNKKILLEAYNNLPDKYKFDQKTESTIDLVPTQHQTAIDFRIQNSKRAEANLHQYTPEMQEFLKYVLLVYVDEGNNRSIHLTTGSLLRGNYGSIQEGMTALGYDDFQEIDKILENFLDKYLYNPDYETTDEAHAIEYDSFSPVPEDLTVVYTNHQIPVIPFDFKKDLAGRVIVFGENGDILTPIQEHDNLVKLTHTEFMSEKLAKIQYKKAKTLPDYFNPLYFVVEEYFGKYSQKYAKTWRVVVVKFKVNASNILFDFYKATLPKSALQLHPSHKEHYKNLVISARPAKWFEGKKIKLTKIQFDEGKELFEKFNEARKELIERYRTTDVDSSLSREDNGHAPKQNQLLTWDFSDAGEITSNLTSERKTQSTKWETYQEALDWIEEESKNYPSKNAFYASPKYHQKANKINKLYEQEKELEAQELWQEVENAGLKKGDRVEFYHSPIVGTSIRYSGIIGSVDKKPYVKFDEGLTTSQGRKSTPWHSGFKLESPNKID